MRYLAAVDTVHTAAALCDYLQGRVDADDEVHAVTVHEDAGEERDRREALNVVEVRLVHPAVETEERSGDPAEELLDAASERDADELVIGVQGGGPGAADGIGSTADAVLGETTRPVAVVPLVEV